MNFLIFSIDRWMESIRSGASGTSSHRRRSELLHNQLVAVVADVRDVLHPRWADVEQYFLHLLRRLLITG